jgi:hypothetical protein
MIRYYVCGLGYNENLEAIDYEIDFGDFDTYEEAYELFVKLQCRNAESFFVNASEVYHIDIRIEECEETEDEIACFNIRNEWGIINPNHKKSAMNREQFVDYVHKNFNVSIEFLRLLDNVLHYAELQGWDEDEIYSYLDFMLDCSVGLEEEEIRRISFEEA